MDRDQEPTFKIVSVEDNVTPEERVRAFYVYSCHLIYGVAKNYGLDPAEFLTPEQIAVAEEAEEAYRREEERLARLGLSVAYSDRPDAVCGGGLPIAECETSQELFRSATDYINRYEARPDANEGEAWTVLAWLGKTCSTCTRVCDVSIRTFDDKPTGLVRVRSMPKLEGPDRIVIDTDSLSLIRSRVSPEELERVKQDFERLREYAAGGEPDKDAGDPATESEQ